MKKLLSAVVAFACILTLFGSLGCSAGDYPTAENISSYLNRSKYLEENLSETTHNLSLKWESSPLALSNVSVIRKSKNDDGTVTVDCKVAAQNEIMELVRYLRFTCKGDLTGWSVQDFTAFDEDQWELNLTIPDGRNEIEEEMFKGYTELTSINIADSVIDIGASAFENCTNLRSVKMSAEVAVFPTAVFKGCTRLETIDFSENVEIFMKESFAGCSSLKLKKLPDFLIFIGTDAFSGCSALMSDLTLPQYTQGVMEGAFRGCTAIRKVSVGKSVQQIGVSTFEGCDNLKAISVATDNPYLKMEGNRLVYSADNTLIFEVK